MVGPEDHKYDQNILLQGHNTVKQHTGDCMLGLFVLYRVIVMSPSEHGGIEAAKVRHPSRSWLQRAAFKVDTPKKASDTKLTMYFDPKGAELLSPAEACFIQLPEPRMEWLYIEQVLHQKRLLHTSADQEPGNMSGIRFCLRVLTRTFHRSLRLFSCRHWHNLKDRLEWKMGTGD